MSCTVVFPASKPVRDAVELKVEAGEIHVRLAHHNAVRPCAECGRACKLHDHQGERSWRHLDTCQYQTMLHAEPPRAESAEHGVRVVKLPWAEPSSRFTALLEALTIEWLKASSQKAVAELLHLSWDAISGGPEIAFRKFVLFGSDFLKASDIRLRAFKRTAESSGFARVERVSFAMWRSCRGLEAKSS